MGDIEVWVKPLGKGKQKAIAIMNRGEEEKAFIFSAERHGISKKSKILDLWLHKDLGNMGKEKTFNIPKHGIIVVKVN